MDLAQKPVYKLDLAAGTSVVNLTTPLVEGDDRAQTFTLELTDKGAPANLNGYSVTAYFGRGKTAEAEADTIPVPGTVSGNVATITLTESCYSRSCYFSMPIRLSNGVTGQKRTYLIVRGTVVKSVDGTIIDPDGSVPSLDDLFAQIAVMERSRQAAEEATEEALAAAARADEARKGIQGDLATLTEDIARNTAPPIIPTATGEIVTISDSANRPLAGLRLYGKTTQDGVPTPNSPVPLVNVGAGGSVGVYSRGKNLFPVGSLFTNRNRTMGLGEQYRVKVSAHSHYTLSFKATFGSDATGYYVAVCGTADGVTDIIAILEDAETKETFYVGDRSEVYIDFARIGGGNDANGWAEFAEIQFEVSTTDTPYEPYKDGGSLTASTPNGLPGIKVTSGGNYTDSTGQQWICDEKDYERGVYVQRIIRRTLNGTEGWAVNNEADNKYTYFWSVHDVGASECLCDKLTAAYTYELNAKDNIVAVTPEYNGVIYLRASGYMTEDTPSALKAMLAQYTPTVMYALATPIETPIPADEMAAYRAMMSQYPHTTVYNDAGAGMAVDYIADTQLYIDNKLAAIAAATL